MLVRLVQAPKAKSPILMTLLGIVMLVRLKQLRKALSPMLVTGLPSIMAAIISSPDTFLSQPVIVTASPSTSYFKLGLTDIAFGGLVSEAAFSGESLEGATLLFSPSHPMRKLKAKSEIKCFMLKTNY